MGCACVSSGVAAEEDVGALKARVEQLEKTVQALQEETRQRSAGDASETLLKRKRALLAVSATGVIQGSTGVEKELSDEEDSTDGVMAFELEAALHATEKDVVYIHVLAGDGGGLDAHLPSISILNGNAYDEGNLLVSEFWYGVAFETWNTVFEVGKIGISGPGDFGPEQAILFDGNEYANNERSQFLAGGFINNLTLEFPDENGVSAMFRVSPLEILDMSAGMGEADGDWYDLFDDLFAIAEINLKPEIRGRAGNYRVYGWYNGKEHENFRDASDTNAVNYGVGLSLDQAVTDWLGIFARYGWQSPDVSQIEASWSAGLQWTAPLPWRPNDRLGVAYGRVCLSGPWESAGRDDGISSADEGHAELYYSLAVRDWVQLTPDIQWVRHPNGERARDDIWILALRARLTF